MYKWERAMYDIVVEKPACDTDVGEDDGKKKVAIGYKGTMSHSDRCR